VEKVNLNDKFALFEDHWNPKVVGDLDDYEIKLVKLRGEFVWHKHDNEDELFLVVGGNLDIEFRDRTINLSQVEFNFIPNGIEHKPHAWSEYNVMLFEWRGVINNGDAGGEFTVKQPARI
jgi:mannose-6-phosphate isomerase-like protein (cupin superfamily)